MCHCWGLLNNISRKSSHLKYFSEEQFSGSFQLFPSLHLKDFYYYTLAMQDHKSIILTTSLYEPFRHIIFLCALSHENK